MQPIASTAISALLGGGTPTTGISGLLAGIADGGSTAPSFGPAALLALSSGQADPISALYSTVADPAARRADAAAPQRNPKRIAEERAVVKASISAAEQGQYAAARQALGDLLRKSPASALAVQAQGVVELAAGEYEKAESFFRKASFLDPSLNAEQDAENARALQRDDKTVIDRAKRLLAQPGTREAGTKLLNVLARRSPSNSEVRILLGDTAVADRDVLAATLNYARAIGNANDGQLGRLEGKLRGLLSQAPDAAFVVSLIGRTQFKRGMLEEALATYGDARRRSGDRVEYRADEASVHTAIARQRLARRDVSGAIASADAASTLDPAGDDVRLVRAESFLARAEQRAGFGDLARSIDDYERAARGISAPGGEALRERIARGAFAVGSRLEQRRLAAGADIEEEVRAYQAAYDADRTNRVYQRKLAETRFAIGDQYYADEDYRNAAGSYRRAYEVDRSRLDYRDAAIRAYNTHGQAQRQRYKFDEAILAYRSAYDLNRNDAAAKATLADVYNQAGEYYRTTGDRTKALAHFREALHLAPNNETYRSNYEALGGQ